LEWLDNINTTKTTETLYLQAIQAFTEYTGKTPEELLDEAEEEINLVN
jgi:hypothetical protein